MHHAFCKDLDWDAIRAQKLNAPLDDASLPYVHVPLDALDLFVDVGVSYTRVEGPLPEFNYLACSDRPDVHLNTVISVEDKAEDGEYDDDSTSEYSCNSVESNFEDGPETPTMSIQTAHLPQIFVNSSPILHTPSLHPAELPLAAQLMPSDLLQDLLLSGRVCSLDGELPIFTAPPAWTNVFPTSSPIVPVALTSPAPEPTAGSAPAISLAKTADDGHAG
ncbi:hypothetical protein OF83DRAFT_355829 [Amylostereum chailletii]|nr:hypothetical protein OF83DRAFT_355829 [Amylostereum chailletii]